MFFSSIYRILKFCENQLNNLKEIALKMRRKKIKNDNTESETKL